MGTTHPMKNTPRAAALDAGAPPLTLSLPGSPAEPDGSPLLKEA
ncbi:hypothetical protein [Streptomyces sp. DSM 118878]